ncbi:unnamed protein product [Calicophoron daubneyi]|uniref:Lipocalin/cytosolic fatty-acid binding domain-containing protein n=1 Tax=Calicophoron daubneyi TaxID=300641 RepID=A0AAV2TSN2_CALDB
MSKFAGTWKFVSNENLEELLTAIGMNEDFIAKSRDDKPTMIIAVSDNDIHMRTEGWTGNLDENLTFDVCSEHKLPSGETYQVTITKESDTRMKAVFTGTATPGHTIYEIRGNELHVSTTAGGVTGKSIFVKS